MVAIVGSKSDDLGRYHFLPADHALHGGWLSNLRERRGYGSVVNFAPGSSPTWGTPQALDGRGVVDSVSCPSTSNCAALDQESDSFGDVRHGSSSQSWSQSSDLPIVEGNAFFDAVSLNPSSGSTTCMVVGYCNSGINTCSSSSSAWVTTNSGTSWTQYLGNVGELPRLPVGPEPPHVRPLASSSSMEIGSAFTPSRSRMPDPIPGTETYQTLPLDESESPFANMNASACRAAERVLRREAPSASTNPPTADPPTHRWPSSHRRSHRSPADRARIPSHNRCGKRGGHQ